MSDEGQLLPRGAPTDPQRTVFSGSTLAHLSPNCRIVVGPQAAYEPSVSA